MSISVNLDRLHRFLTDEISLSAVNSDSSRLYGTCSFLCQPQTDKAHISVYALGEGSVNYLPVSLFIGENGIVYRAMFPVRCISADEIDRMQQFITLLNESLTVDSLFMKEGCVYLTRGMTVEGVNPSELRVFSMNGAHFIAGTISVLSPFMLEVIGGADVCASAEAAAAAYCSSDAQNEDSSCEEEPLPAVPMLVPAREINLPDLERWLDK